MFRAKISRFLSSRSGSTSIMAGTLFLIMIGAVGAAIDITSLQNTDSKLQRAMDAGSLAAARTYRESGDETASIEIAENIFDTHLEKMPRVSATRTFSVNTDDNSGTITATGTSVATLDGMFMKRALEAKIESKTELSAKNPDLYLYMLIDATGSMGPLIDSVRDASKALEANIRTRLVAEQVGVGHIFAKVGFFRDLRSEESSPAWIESPIYDLAIEDEVDALHLTLDAEPAAVGGDLPESSLAAIGQALYEPLPVEIDSGNVIQVIMLWTDAASLPLDSTDGQDDITVALWKRLGAPDTRFASGENTSGTIIRDWLEADERTWPSPNPNDGCCATFAELESAWNAGGTVPVKNRRLGVSAPLGSYPWPSVASWQNTVIENYETPSSGNDIVDDVLNALQTEYSPLRVSH